MQPLGVVEADPVERLVFGVLVGGEAAAVDELALEGRDPCFGDRVVVGVSFRADGRGRAELVEAVGVGEAGVLGAAIGVRDQPPRAATPTIIRP